MASLDQSKPSALQPALPSPVTMLQLCQASYRPPGDIRDAVKTVQPQRQWRCVWGPAQDDDHSNLAFVAAYGAEPDQPPLYLCVTIRGTDFDIKDDWGKVEQVFEDVDFTTQSAPSWAPNALIAQGTLDALAIIEDLTDEGQTLLDHLMTFFADPANSNVVLLINGHSLGGCLATVVAPWLQNRLGRSVLIVPYTFAAPTAGNADFVSFYESAFPDAVRYHNSLDAVPSAYADIAGLDTLYAPCGIETPPLIYAAVIGFGVAMWLADVSYAQPARNAIQLAGTCCPTTDWYAQAGYQHHTTTYMSLLPNGVDLAGTMVALCPAGRRSRGALSKRLGPLPAVVQKLEWLRKLRSEL